MKIWSVSLLGVCLLADALVGYHFASKSQAATNESTPATNTLVLQLTEPLHLGGKTYSAISLADIPALRKLTVQDSDGQDAAVELATEDGKTATAHTCEEWEKLTAKKYYARNGAEIRNQFPFVEASAIFTAIQHAKTPKVSYIKQVGVKNLELLPVEMLPWRESDDHELHDQLTVQGVSIAELIKRKLVRLSKDDEPANQSQQVVRLLWGGKLTGGPLGNEEESELVSAYLRELAHGDFSGSGFEEILVHAGTHLVGSGFTYGFFLLTRTTPTGLFQFKPCRGDYDGVGN